MGSDASRLAGRSDEVRPLRLLVVDDDRDALEMMIQGLRVLGHEGVPATNGADALALASADLDGGIIDGNLPDLDGLAIARELRRRGPTLPLVLCTGDERLTSELAIAAGFDARTSKPASVVEMLGLLRTTSTGIFEIVG